VTAADVFKLAQTQPDAAVLTAEFNRELALHVVNLSIAIDPIRIVWPAVSSVPGTGSNPSLRRALDAAVPFPPELTVARFPSDAPLVGALALGVQAAGADLGEEAFAMIIDPSSRGRRG